MYVHTYVWASRQVYIHVYMFLFMNQCMRVCLYVCLHVCLSVCICVCKYCMYACLYTYVYVRVCAYACMYIDVCVLAPARWWFREEAVGSPSTNSKGFARTCWAETVTVAAHAYTHKKHTFTHTTVTGEKMQLWRGLTLFINFPSLAIFFTSPWARNRC